MMMKRPFLVKLRRWANGWMILTGMGAAVMLLPILYVLSGLFNAPNDNWLKVKEYLLIDYIAGSVKLTALTVVFAVSLGVLLAWLVAGYRFPLQRFFRWALILPLAVPPYIAAYTYSAMTSYTGIIQVTLRNWFDIRLEPGTIEVMSLRGAVFILTLFLFPYVFMIVRTFMERQSASYIENARLLGHNHLSQLFRIVLPISRPAIVAGGMLVVFEVLSDYGVSSFFGLQTMSTSIFQTWFGMYDIDSALRLAAWLMLVVISLFVMERWLRRNRQYNATTSRSHPLQLKPLKGWAAWSATILCSLVFILSFALPIGQIAIWTVWTYGKVWRSDFVDLMMNSLMGAMLATCIIMVVAILTARTERMFPSTAIHVLSRFMSAGYAIPGAIIAVGVLAIFIALDRTLSPFYGWIGKGENMLVLSLSLTMLIAGYIIRFLATGFNAMEAGYEKLSRSYSEASRTLGRSELATFFKIELPLLKSSLLLGFVLTLVEIMKELPLTLLLRPFNYDTLSTRVYRYAMDERIYEAALPALLLIILSLISVLIILRLEKEKKT